MQFQGTHREGSMQNPKQRDGSTKKPEAALTDSVQVKKTIGKPPASKVLQKTVGAKSKTLDLTKNFQSKSTEVSAICDSLNPVVPKNKDPAKNEIQLDRTLNAKDTVSLLKTTSLGQEFEKILLASPHRSAHSGITFKPKKLISSGVNIFLPPKDASSQISTTLQYPKETEKLEPSLGENESAKFSKGNIEKTRSKRPSLIPVKETEGKTEYASKSVKLKSSKQNAALSAKISFTDQLSNLRKPNLAHEVPNPTRKNLQASCKDTTKESTQTTRIGKNAVSPIKETVPTRSDKANSSKMLRSKTEVSINPRPGKKTLPKVQSFSRLKPETSVTKKPAHEAILDITTLVKGEPKVVHPPLTSAHSGIPFKPKKRTTFAAVNIFAQVKDGTKE